MLHNFLRIVMLLTSLNCFIPIVSAQEAQSFVVYDDELKNDWQNWSWAEVSLDYPVGNAKPIKVSGGPWSALALHHEPFSVETYSKLSFFINGGLEGGQTLAVKLIVDGKPLESAYLVQPKMKTWAIAEISLKELGADDRKVDGIWIQAQGEKINAYYITRIQFE
jgi:hypothetical protein